MAEIEAVALLGTEPMRGGTRFYFAGGGRLRLLARAGRGGGGRGGGHGK